MSTPAFYNKPFIEAVNCDEVLLYRQSMQSNMECVVAIDETIAAHFDGYRLGSDLAAPIIAQFGAERVEYLLAVSVLYNEWDGRISKDNKTWARASSVVNNMIDDPQIRRHCLVADGSSGLLNLFINDFREAVQHEKPSALQRLSDTKKAQPKQPKAAVTKPDKEVR